MRQSNQDKLLADKVVALGLARETEIMAGGHGNEHPETIYILNDNTLNAKDAERFVRDWSVAGACFEALDRTVHDMISLIQSAVLIEQRERNWPRAIIEACVEELERV